MNILKNISMTATNRIRKIRNGFFVSADFGNDTIFSIVVQKNDFARFSQLLKLRIVCMLHLSCECKPAGTCCKQQPSLRTLHSFALNLCIMSWSDEIVGHKL